MEALSKIGEFFFDDVASDSERIRAYRKYKQKQRMLNSPKSASDHKKNKSKSNQKSSAKSNNSRSTRNNVSLHREQSAFTTDEEADLSSTESTTGYDEYDETTLGDYDTIGEEIESVIPLSVTTNPSVRSVSTQSAISDSTGTTHTDFFSTATSTNKTSLHRALAATSLQPSGYGNAVSLRQTRQGRSLTRAQQETIAGFKPFEYQAEIITNPNANRTQSSISFKPGDINANNSNADCNQSVTSSRRVSSRLSVGEDGEEQEAIAEEIGASGTTQAMMEQLLSDFIGVTDDDDGKDGEDSDDDGDSQPILDREREDENSDTEVSHSVTKASFPSQQSRLPSFGTATSSKKSTKKNGIPDKLPRNTRRVPSESGSKEIRKQLLTRSKGSRESAMSKAKSDGSSKSKKSKWSNTGYLKSIDATPKANESPKNDNMNTGVDDNDSYKAGLSSATNSSAPKKTKTFVEQTLGGGDGEATAVDCIELAVASSYDENDGFESHGTIQSSYGTPRQEDSNVDHTKDETNQEDAPVSQMFSRDKGGKKVGILAHSKRRARGGLKSVLKKGMKLPTIPERMRRSSATSSETTTIPDTTENSKVTVDPPSVHTLGIENVASLDQRLSQRNIYSEVCDNETTSGDTNTVASTGAGFMTAIAEMNNQQVEAFQLTRVSDKSPVSSASNQVGKGSAITTGHAASEGRKSVHETNDASVLSPVQAAKSQSVKEQENTLKPLAQLRHSTQSFTNHRPLSCHKVNNKVSGSFDVSESHDPLASCSLLNNVDIAAASHSSNSIEVDDAVELSLSAKPKTSVEHYAMVEDSTSAGTAPHPSSKSNADTPTNVCKTRSQKSSEGIEVHPTGSTEDYEEHALTQQQAALLAQMSPRRRKSFFASTIAQLKMAVDNKYRNQVGNTTITANQEVEVSLNRPESELFHQQEAEQRPISAKAVEHDVQEKHPNPGNFGSELKVMDTKDSRERPGRAIPETRYQGDADSVDDGDDARDAFISLMAKSHFQTESEANTPMSKVVDSKERTEIRGRTSVRNYPFGESSLQIDTSSPSRLNPSTQNFQSSLSPKAGHSSERKASSPSKLKSLSQSFRRSLTPTRGRSVVRDPVMVEAEPEMNDSGPSKLKSLSQNFRRSLKAKRENSLENIFFGGDDQPKIRGSGQSETKSATNAPRLSLTPKRGRGRSTSPKKRAATSEGNSSLHLITRRLRSLSPRGRKPSSQREEGASGNAQKKEWSMRSFSLSRMPRRETSKRANKILREREAEMEDITAMQSPTAFLSVQAHAGDQADSHVKGGKDKGFWHAGYSDYDANRSLDKELPIENKTSIVDGNGVDLMHSIHRGKSEPTEGDDEYYRAYEEQWKREQTSKKQASVGTSSLNSSHMAEVLDKHRQGRKTAKVVTFGDVQIDGEGLHGDTNYPSKKTKKSIRKFASGVAGILKTMSPRRNSQSTRSVEFFEGRAKNPGQEHHQEMADPYAVNHFNFDDELEGESTLSVDNGFVTQHQIMAQSNAPLWQKGRSTETTLRDSRAFNQLAPPTLYRQKKKPDQQSTLQRVLDKKQNQVQARKHLQVEPSASESSGVALSDQYYYGDDSTPGYYGPDSSFLMDFSSDYSEESDTMGYSIQNARVLDTLRMLHQAKKRDKKRRQMKQHSGWDGDCVANQVMDPLMDEIDHGGYYCV